jgi:hypothetical protein
MIDLKTSAKNEDKNGTKIEPKNPPKIARNTHTHLYFTVPPLLRSSLKFLVLRYPITIPAKGQSLKFLVLRYPITIPAKGQSLKFLVLRYPITIPAKGQSLKFLVARSSKRGFGGPLIQRGQRAF